MLTPQAPPRALLVDLDRTLLGPDKTLEERTRVRMREVRDRGVLLVVVASRPLPELLALGLDRHCDALVAEGGAVVSVPKRRVLDVRGDTFPQLARRAMGPVATAFSWGRVAAAGPRKAGEDASRALTASGVPHTLVLDGDAALILPAAVHKGSATLRILERLGVAPIEAWALGDGEDDAPMLAIVGWSAAPANAAPAAREAARHVLENVYADAFLEMTDAVVSARNVPVDRVVPIKETAAPAPASESTPPAL